MSADAKRGESEIAAAMREMLDGFREAGVLLNADVDCATQTLLAPDEPSVE
jgi:hypothetical protein